MPSLPPRFRDSLREVRVSRDQDVGRLPKLLTASIRHSHEQSYSRTHWRRSKARPDAGAAIAAALAATALNLTAERYLSICRPRPARSF